MPSPLSPEDELINEADFAFRKMVSMGSVRATPILEKWLRPYIRLAIIDAEIRGAEARENKLLENKAARNEVAFRVAQLEQEKRGRRE